MSAPVRAAKGKSIDSELQGVIQGRLARYPTDPVAFIDDCLRLNELGQPWRLQPQQRAVLARAFAFDKARRLPYDTIVYSAPKPGRRPRRSADHRPADRVP